MSASPAAPKVPGLMFKLSLMMFLQFFIWGVWFEIGFSYIPALKFGASWMNALVFNAFNFGALVALFFSTQFADRKFAAEKFLAISHLVGGLAILGLFFLQTPVGRNVGEFQSATILEQGSYLTEGIGKLADGTPVTVKNAIPEKDAAKYWSDLAEKVAKFESKDDPKMKDPRPAVTFTVKETGAGGIVGDAAEPLAPFWPFFALMLIHSIFYVPTISITNSIAFTAFTNPDKQFGPVRLWGTIGWIVASWPFIFILVDWPAVNASGKEGLDYLSAALGTPLGGAEGISGKRYVFLLAGVASILLAAFSLLLPHTPPKPAAAGDSLAWLKAMRYLAKPFIAVLFLVTFIDAAVHQSYFVWIFDFLEKGVGIPGNWVAASTKIGQVAEVITMLALGTVLKNLGWRWTMVIGVLGHAARFAVFAYLPEKLPVLAVIGLHGICYAFFFATVYIFVDKFFPKDVRSSAQGLFNVLILGVGPVFANTACGFIKAFHTVGDQLDYTAVFQYSLGAALVGALMLALFFHPPKETSAHPNS